MDGFICHCGDGHRAGFTLVHGWWVCAKCRLPTASYTRAMLRDTITTEHRNRNDDEEDEVGLVYFEGGPLDTYVQETSVLLGRESLGLPLINDNGEPLYVWTDRTITGANTGQVARVWRYAGTWDTEQPSQPTVTAKTATSELHEAVSEATAASGSPTGDAGTSQPTTTGTTAQDDSAATTGAIDDELDGPKLLARRKALKLSRGVVVEKTGLAHSKVHSIETNSGKRVTDAERRTLADALTAIEAERGVGGGAGARE